MSSVRRLALPGRVHSTGLHSLPPTQRWPREHTTSRLDNTVAGD